MHAFAEPQYSAKQIRLDSFTQEDEDESAAVYIAGSSMDLPAEHQACLEEIVQTIEGELEPKAQFAAWHPDSTEAQTRGRVSHLVPPMPGPADQASGWNAWWDGTAGYVGEVYRWARRADRAALRRSKRFATRRRAHDFKMNR